LRRVCWPINFKLTGIDKYDGFTNPAEWLEVYHFTIKAVGGDSYVMTKLLAHLPIVVSQNMAHGASHRIGPIMV
jgi:hypothetical protein